MDEKKVREAIEAFQGQVDWLKRIDDRACTEARRCCIEYFDTAIEALEKQLPKKRIKEEITKGVNRGLHNFYCPICYEKGELSNKCNVGEYCSDCGQRLDWSE